MPTIGDPKLFQVRVRKNQEKIAVLALLKKCSDYAKQGRPLSILSVTSPDSTEGCVYIEAFKETHIRDAIQGLHYFLNKLTLIKLEEMPGIYQTNNQYEPMIKDRSWVRIKQGLYNGDIGFVELLKSEKVWVRLIPRIEPDPLTQRLREEYNNNDRNSDNDQNNDTDNDQNNVSDNDQNKQTDNGNKTKTKKDKNKTKNEPTKEEIKEE